MGYTNVNVPMIADEALTAGMLLAVTGDGLVKEAEVDSIVLGVAYADAAKGDLVAVITGVEVELTISAAVTAGNRLKAAANGRVCPSVDGTTVENLVFGIALTSGTTAGDKIRVLI